MIQNPEKIIKISIIGLFTFVLLGYSLFQAQNILLGPTIEVNTPQNGLLLNNSLVTISGTAKNISHIYMNDRQIFTDEKGLFNEKILLSHGYNVIAIRANDRFEREVIKMLELIYK